MPIISVEVYWGATQHGNRNEQDDLLVGDLINRCKAEYGLPEQERGTLIRYGMYHDLGAGRRLLMSDKSLRELRVHSGDNLYLSRPDPLWWQEPAQDTASAVQETRPASPTMIPICTVELAPQCVVPVPAETGLAINRTFLVRTLPPPMLAMERLQTFIGQVSRLTAVSRDETGHCRICWSDGWVVIARQPVHIGSAVYTNGASFALECTTTLLLGADGWPITVRLDTRG